MAAAVASPPPRAPPQDAPPVTQLWDEICAAPQPPRRVASSSAGDDGLVELARAALSDDASTEARGRLLRGLRGRSAEAWVSWAGPPSPRTS